MKLKEFNPENTTPVRGGRAVSTVPNIGVSLKGGLFRFNKPSMELIGLKEGDKVLVHQDEDEPADWYLEKVKDKGFPLRAKTKITPGLLFGSTTLMKNIFESVDYKGKSGRILIAGKPTEFQKRKLWGLLTTSLKNAE